VIPAGGALADAGITHLAQLAGLPRADVDALHDRGPKALRNLEATLAGTGPRPGA
jgi:predicted flap endonuclease-1-like 5' DNA nuclease